MGQHAHEHGEVVSGRAAGSEPEGPTELPKRSWWAVLMRAARAFGKDNLTDWAAEVVPGFVDFEAAVPRLVPAMR